MVLNDFGRVAEGGWPGGGAGHGGNPHWAAGGGGGCSMVAKKESAVDLKPIYRYNSIVLMCFLPKKESAVQ